jgi:hypothetical protein
MIIPPCDSAVSLFDAGSKALGYKRRIRQIANQGNEVHSPILELFIFDFDDSRGTDGP